MSRESNRTVLINGLLSYLALGLFTSTALLAPGAVKLFNKPLKDYFNKKDEKQRQKELRAALRYMKYNQLITENYQHGLSVTAKAKKRLQRLDFEQINIPSPKLWDYRWRIIFFDIPEKNKSKRDAFAAKMRQLGFKVLQRSVFIHPFPCHDEVLKVSEFYGLSRYISYIETNYIDNDAALRKHFSSLLK